ncbi:PREDICTED: H/ACA ribonucleoprotein complex subunit 2-like protein [Acromyrmex echinatior]|uniref:H/ACA ribonucleoprotein complex subunit 2-like protein n=1 Tax=Acromyrmex echinatior TaxID=103372 RepID=UPI000580DFEA|nr:PREDICTED: H/ACA ribonucleoprotein complex subunit 2-like protein [Acromyrmex echinatior]XP_011054176.1 PREDICTED: H/ACA ribonucleoprotein complex subunit 2-like protein [Acromyrmex echinatior]
MQETIKMEIDDSVVKNENIDAPEISYEKKLRFVNAIAKPLASKKLTKKIYKCIKKASKYKNNVRNGLKDVQKHLRRGERGLVVFAGDVYPIDIMCHLPIICEDKDIPYCFTPSRMDIGAAMNMKRGSLVVLITESYEYRELYDEIKAAMKTLSAPL